MGRAYKNFWSLNVDEVVVSGIVREGTPKNMEILMPMNAQMKDTDLVLMNMDNKKSATIQVKGSRAYEPKKSERVKFGDGSGGWFCFKKDVVFKSGVDFFIFLVYVLEENKKAGRWTITSHTITVSTEKLRLLCEKHKKAGKDRMYNFFLWVNPAKKKSFEFRGKTYDTSKYLDKRGLKQLSNYLK